MNSIIITKEEILKFLEQEPKKYYWNEHYEYVEDEEQAWDSFYDNYCCDHDLDISEEELIKRLSED